MGLLSVAIILLLALLATRISDRFGIPSLLLFILLGMGFEGLGIEFDNYTLAESVASLSLLIIIFYGGFGTNWTMAKPVAVPSILLSFGGVVVTAVLTGLFCHTVLGFSMLEGMLVGSVVGSTDYASVSSILRSKKLNLRHSTAPFLELESGSNDPFAYTMTMIFLSLLLGDSVSIGLLIFKQVLFGVATGFIMAYVIERVIECVSLSQDGLFAVFIAATALLTFSIAVKLGGNGYLAVYIFGIHLGSQEFVGKRDVVFFFDGFTELMQIGLFFLLGLLSDIGSFISYLPMALAIMVFMTLIARPVSVFALMLPFKMERNQLTLISFAGLRGAAAIAFAIMAINQHPPLQHDLYALVFGICLLSSLVQGGLMPWMVNKLEMLDPSDTILKTFNYYQDKTDIGFLKTQVMPGSELAGTKIRDLNLTFDFLVAKVERNGEKILPHGNVTLQEGDEIVLAGETYFDPKGQELTEFTISKWHPWVNQYIRDLKLPLNNLILIIKREEESIVVPNGDTKILDGDVIILMDIEELEKAGEDHGI